MLRVKSQKSKVNRTFLHIKQEQNKKQTQDFTLDSGGLMAQIDHAKRHGSTASTSSPVPLLPVLSHITSSTASSVLPLLPAHDWRWLLSRSRRGNFKSNHDTVRDRSRSGTFVLRDFYLLFFLLLFLVFMWGSAL